jgi:hypothetical protein
LSQSVEALPEADLESPNAFDNNLSRAELLKNKSKSLRNIMKVEVEDLEPAVEFGFISKPNRVGIAEFTDEVHFKKPTVQFEFS